MTVTVLDRTTDHATGRSDAELLIRLRAGEDAAAHQLLRRHRAAVAELGPSQCFSSVDASGKVALVQVRDAVDRDLPFRAAWLALHATGTLPTAPGRATEVWDAFTVLPAAWQVAVWHREVEGQRLPEIAGHLGMDQEQASRALTSAYASLKRRVALAHTPTSSAPECEEIHATYRLSPPAVLPLAEVRALREHGRHCDSCLGLIRALFTVEHTLRDTLAAVVLGDAAEDYLASRPRVARLRLPGPARPALTERRVNPILASLTATAVGASAMALALAGPQFTQLREPADAVTAQPPVLGSFLTREAAASPSGLGVLAPEPVTLTPVAADAAASTASGGRDDASAGPDEVAAPDGSAPLDGDPTTGTSGPDGEPGTPTGPPAADGDEPDLTVSVAVSQSQATVAVDGLDPDAPVAVEVPLPELPVPGTDDPAGSLDQATDLPVGLP